MVGADVVQYAKAAAEAMGAKLDGKGTVAVTVGSFNQTENLVAETFKATMAEKYPDIKVLDPQEEGFDQAQAIAKASCHHPGQPRHHRRLLHHRQRPHHLGDAPRTTPTRRTW